MPFFSAKQKKKNQVHKDARVDLRALKTTASYAKERGSKIAATKTVRFFRALLIVSVLSIVAAGFLGFIGLLAYSLKSGEKISIFENVGKFLQTTPLKVFVKSTDTKGKIVQVVGVPGVLEYPGSSFMFAEYINRVGDEGFTIVDKKLSDTDAQAIYTFLTGGQSVYRLPVNVTWEQVQQYYLDNLSKTGWKFETSVSVLDTEKIPGEYYTKDEKGLHIYSVSSDIWYETVTKEQAIAGLHDKIVSYKAKQELVAAASGTDLPPDAVWKMKYSRDWDVSLQKNVVYGVNNLYFTHDTSKDKVTISVLSRYKGNMIDLTYKNLETVGVEFISTWLTTQQTAVTLQGFTRTERMVADGKALEFTDLKNHAHFLFLLNKKNGLYYVVQYIGKENPEFFEYVKENLKN